MVGTNIKFHYSTSKNKFMLPSPLPNRTIPIIGCHLKTVIYFSTQVCNKVTSCLQHLSLWRTGIKHDQKAILKTRYFSGSCYVAIQTKYSLQKGSQNSKNTTWVKCVILKFGPHTILSNKECTSINSSKLNKPLGILNSKYYNNWI
jgi:hypothetical protein